MESLFRGMPLIMILSGNLLLCAIGATFTLGAPAQPSRVRLKPYIVAFWCLLTAYYFARLLGHLVQLKLALALEPWIVLVVLADLCPMILCLGFGKYISPPVRHADIFICFPFVLAWLSAIFMGHNAVSQMLTTLAFLFVAWRSRLTSINISLILISYGLLSLPFGLFWDAPRTFGQSVFLLLLAAKMPLLGALYQVLTMEEGLTKSFANCTNKYEGMREKRPKGPLQ
jgi:hypothetical protein